MKGYTTIDNIENYLVMDIDSSFEDQVNTWIEQIEAYIDRQTGRNFIADTAATRRFYTGDNTRKLIIDDAVEVTEVKIGTDPALTERDDDDLDAEYDYIVTPTNDTPKTGITLMGLIFPSYPEQTISVKAKWGFSEAVPADITNVATVLLAGIVNYSLQSEGEVQSKSMGIFQVTYKDEKQWKDFDRIESVLASYKKFHF
jgi:hypothetical protein